MSDPYLLPPTAAASIADHQAWIGGDAVRLARTLTPRALIERLDASGLRRRDSGGTRVASRWASFAANDDQTGPRHLVVDATDIEPGSFADRALLRTNALGVMEGLAIAARALGASSAHLALRSTFAVEHAIVHEAMADAESAGWLDDVKITIHRTSDHYVLSDERALLEALEGREPLPVRLAPELDGLFSRPGRRDVGPPTLPDPANPTIVEGLETLASLGPILMRGTQWFRSMGTVLSPGHILCTVTGDVAAHAVGEAELGRRLMDVIDTIGGGFLPRTPPKAVLNGLSSPVLTRSRLGAPLAWEGLGGVGAAVAKAAFIVCGEHCDMAAVATAVARYLYVESCGLCPACKFGGGEVAAYLDKLGAGAGTAADIDALIARLASLTETRRCDVAARHRDVVSSILRAYPGDVSAALAGAEPREPWTLPLIADLRDGRAVIAVEPMHRRPDWVLDDQPIQLNRWSGRR